jgi:hypothetical protein
MTRFLQLSKIIINTKYIHTIVKIESKYTIHLIDPSLNV